MKSQKRELGSFFGGIDNLKSLPDFIKKDKHDQSITATGLNSSFKPPSSEYLVDRDGDGPKWNFWVPKGDTEPRPEICEVEHGVEVTELRSCVADVKAKLDNLASLER